MSQLLIEPVVTGTQFTDFVELPLRLHPRDRYVPLLQPQLRDWWRGQHPQARFGPVRYFLARRGHTVVGRICLHHNPDFDAKLGSDTQLFGLAEFVDADSAQALLTLAEQEAGLAGRCQVIGPVALLPNQTGGVITSGFAERGFMDSPWNPEHYPAAYEGAGYARIFTGQTWICDNFAELDPDTTFVFDEARIADEGLRVQPSGPVRLRRDLEDMRQVLNASFAKLPYYTTISKPDLAAQTEGLEALLDGSLFLRLTRRGEPIAFALLVPDISEFVMARGGRLSLRDQAALLATRGRYRDEAIIIIKGTSPQAQGRGYLTLLSRELLRNLQAGGYRALRSTFVEDENAASASQYVRMGGRALHGTAFYRKEIR